MKGFGCFMFADSPELHPGSPTAARKGARNGVAGSLSRWLLMISFFSVVLPAAAGGGGGHLPDGVQVHGFLSQGFVKTSANRFFGPSEGGSWDLREIGVNASWQARPDLLFSGQLLSRTAGEMYGGGVQLDYGLVDYAPLMDADGRVGIRLGRIKNPIGLYNDTRDVPFTRPSIFLPQSIYFDKVRNSELLVDGGALYGDWLTRGGVLSFQVNVGNLLMDENMEYAFLGFDGPGELKNDGLWWIGRLGFEALDGRLRLFVSQASGAMDYRQAAADFLQQGKIRLDFRVFSLQYLDERWGFTAEYLREPVDWRGFGPAVVDRASVADGWYLQGTWRPLDDWELLLRYDVSHLDKNDPNGDRQSGLLGLPNYVFFAKDLTLGLTWDLDSRIRLRAEYHRVEGASWLSPRENVPQSITRDWDLFALQASFRF